MKYRIDIWTWGTKSAVYESDSIEDVLVWFLNNWAYTYDKKHWCVVYNGKCVNRNFIGTFEEVVDFIEEKNKNIKPKMVHW